MRASRETFLHVLADNLTGVTVHGLRFDKDDREAGCLQMNAVNVSFLGSTVDTVGNQQAAIDIVFDNELAALDVAKQVAALLRKAAFTPKLDYANPVVPVDTGTNISWSGVVTFTNVYSENYFHLTALVPIFFTL